MRKREGVVLLLFLGLLVFFFRDTWLSGRSYFARDITFVFHPLHSFSAENLQAGHFPLWNPYVASGVPWSADPQTGFFYPGNLPFFFFPFVGAFKFHGALHFFLTGLGAYLLARSRGGRPGGALAAALLWSLNGFWLSRLEFPSLLGSISWLPWAVLFALARNTTALAAVLAFSVLSGHLPHALWTFVLTLAAAAALPNCKNRVIALWGAGALAAVLCAAQLLQTAASVLRSERWSEGFSLAVSGFGSLTPRHLLGFFFPAMSAMGSLAYSGEKYFWLGSFHIGMVGALLAAAAYGRANARAKALGGGLVALGALLALGNNTPVYGFLHGAFGFFRLIRYPGQYTFLLTGAALLAAALWPFRRRAGWIAALLAMELFFLGQERFPVLPSAYFRARPQWADVFQGGNPGERLLLSPRAAMDTTGKGGSAWESWSDLRGRFLLLTAVPYHLATLSPYGFSPMPREAARFIAGLYASSGPAQVLGRLTTAHVRWIAAPSLLSVEGLTLLGKDPWFLYENTKTKSPGPWTLYPDGPTRRVFRGEGTSLQTSDLDYPGWQAWVSGRPVLIGRGNEIFQSVRLPSGAREVRFIYRPRVFTEGVLISFLALASLGVFCIMKLKVT